MLFIQLLFNLILIHYIRLIDCKKIVLYEEKSSICSRRNSFYTCNPTFENVIRTAKVTVTNSCGLESRDDSTCKYWKYLNHYSLNNQYQCSNCNRRNRRRLYSLDNIRDSNNQTCWFSGRLRNKPNKNYVNITLDFNKRFEIYFMMMEFCSDIPDNIEIYKSNDFGYSYTPWKYFSKDCKTSFNLSHSFNNDTLTCTNLDKFIKRRVIDTLQPTVLFLPPLPDGANESSLNLITITNIRIKLSRFVKKSALLYPITKYFNQHMNNTNSALSLLLSQNGKEGLLDDNLHYGISEMNVAGRCLCNGHSNKCIIDDNDEDVKKNRGKEGLAKSKIKCVCHHHTTGDDCEKCANGFNDQPWKRGTVSSVNPCKRCRCNLHSRDCRFSETAFIETKGRSGGVCHKCLHNTTGRYCHKCQDGFQRDWSKPLSHENACISCQCHKVGSKFPYNCNKKNGQCVCKEGVGGKRCNRCKNGYQDSSRPSSPCVRQIGRRFAKSLQSKKHANYGGHPMPNTQSECKPCNEKRKRIRFKKFCRRSGVFMGSILSKEVHNKMVRFEVKIENIWRLTGKMNKYIVSPSPSSADSSMYGASSTTTAIWLNHDDVRCNCPSVRLGVKYLMLTKSTSKTYLNRLELRMNDNRRSVVLRWRPNWKRRLGRFAKKARRGLCAKFKRRRTSKFNRRRRRMLRKRYLINGRRRYRRNQSNNLKNMYQ